MKAMEIFNEPLLKTTMEFKNKVAIITGAGAVENAWSPILTIFRSMSPLQVDADAANCFFARCIYLLRTYSKYPDEKSEKNLKTELGTIKTLKELICEFISRDQKQGILRVRKDFKRILYRFVFSDPENLFGLISTNWDTTVDKEADDIVKNHFVDIDNAKCFHIHGSIECPDRLYLPSETSHENYRTDEENKIYAYNHFATLKFLQQADRIILYGLSLDPLDAELSQILNSTFTTSRNLQEIIIINPDYKRIRNRVLLLLYPKNHIKIKCFLPENLENEI
ncbi:MAG: hypothetical protein JST86_05410 [Bacteroidetes bacterium]|nr:hypothetical protein [Bacteroidota bacterium]